MRKGLTLRLMEAILDCFNPSNKWNNRDGYGMEHYRNLSKSTTSRKPRV